MEFLTLGMGILIGGFITGFYYEKSLRKKLEKKQETNSPFAKKDFINSNVRS